MRVLQVLPAVVAGGGAEQSLVMLASHLIERGVDLHLAFLRGDDSMIPEVEAAGVVVHDLRGAERILPDWAFLLRRLLRELRPAVVHSTLLSADTATRFGSLGLGAAVLTTWANTTYDPVRRRLEPVVNSWKFELVRWGDLLTSHMARSWYHAVTEGVADDGVAALHVPRERVFVVERGRDLSRFAPVTPERRRAARETIGMDDGHTVLVCVARYFHQKGHVHLLRAFDRLAAGDPELRLVLVGPDGPATPAVRDAVARMQHGDKLLELGQRRDVADLLPAADVYVLPSLAEGAAGSVLEAMATGIPVVASDLAGYKGWLLDGEHARLARPGDADDLASVLREVLADPEGRASRAERARAHVFERFSIERCATDMVAMYRVLAARARWGNLPDDPCRSE